METHTTEVFVHLGGAFCHVGRLSTTEDTRDFRRARFRYAPDYLDADDAIPIDPVSLPLSLGQRAADAPELFGAFADAYPDRFGEHIWMALEREYGVRNSYHTYLVSGSRDRIGALAFGPSADEPLFDEPLQQEFSRRTEHDLASLAEAADRFQTEGFHALPPALRPFLSTGYSVGGSRPKALVNVNGVSMIAKFSMPRHDPWNEPRIEYAALRLARKMGLDVPNVACTQVMPVSRVDTAGLRDVFLIERFDRDAAHNRLHVVSAKTMLAARDFETHSYQELAAAIARHAPAGEVARGRLELFRRAVFNVLINNEDDHLKNHAFLWRGGGYCLTPLYDAVPAPNPTTSLQLALGHHGTSRTLENCVTDPAPFGLDEAGAQAIVEEMAETFYATWKEAFRECGVEDRDMAMLERLLARPVARSA